MNKDNVIRERGSHIQLTSGHKLSFNPPMIVGSGLVFWLGAITLKINAWGLNSECGTAPVYSHMNKALDRVL